MFQRDRAGKAFYILVYVDDLVLAADDFGEFQAFKEEMSSKFTMTDLGELRYYLGLHVVRDRERRALLLHQRKYIEETLELFGMAECKPVKTPLNTGHDLTKEEPFKEGEEAEMNSHAWGSPFGNLTC